MTSQLQRLFLLCQVILPYRFLRVGHRREKNKQTKEEQKARAMVTTCRGCAHGDDSRHLCGIRRWRDSAEREYVLVDRTVAEESRFQPEED